MYTYVYICMHIYFIYISMSIYAMGTFSSAAFRRVFVVFKRDGRPKKRAQNKFVQHFQET